MAESERQLGDVLANVPTQMLKIIESLWTSWLFGYDYKNIQGLKYCGLGGLYINSGIVKNSSAKLHVYFYNSTGTATLDGKEILPSFMLYDLSIDDSKIVGIGSDVSTLPESGKEAQILSVSTPLSGNTQIRFYFPQGVGTGEINSMCVSLVPLDYLKDLPTVNSIFAGVLFEGSTYNPYQAGRYFIPKCMMVEVEGSFGIGQNKSSGNAVLVYTINMGNFKTVDITLSKKPCWGLGRKKDGFYYFISTAVKLCKYEIETGTITEGSSTSNLLQYGLIEINGELYNQGNPSSSSITLKKVDTTTLTGTTTTYTFTIPSFGITGNANLIQFENGDYGVIYYKNGMVFRFTDITDPVNSVVDVYFSGIIDGMVIPIEEDGKVYFYGATTSGVYPAINTFGGSGTTYLHILSDAQVGSPIIAYNKYNTSFSKTADTQLTTTTTISIP